MTHTNDPAFYASIRPQVTIFQEQDGTWKMEYMLKGFRHVVEVNPSLLIFEVKEAFADMVRYRDHMIEDAMRRKAEAELNTARKAYRYVATNHGIEFANRTVKGLNSSKYGAKKDEPAVKLGGSAFL